MMNLFKKKDKALVKQEPKKKNLPKIPANIQTVEGLIQLALQSNAGIEQLQKLIDMKYMDEEREARKDYFQALSEFQATVGPIVKDRTVSFQTGRGQTMYKHASLGQIEKQIKGPLCAKGLSKHFEIEDTGKIKVTCIITHVSGHSEKTSMDAPADNSGSKNTIQSCASTVTYLQRYTLISVLGLVTADEDNDGAGDDAKPKKTTAPQKGETDAVLGKVSPIDDIPFEIVDEPKEIDPKLVPSINALKRLFSKVYNDCSKDELKKLFLELCGPENKLTDARIKELASEFTAELKNSKREAQK